MVRAPRVATAPIAKPVTPPSALVPSVISESSKPLTVHKLHASVDPRRVRKPNGPAKQQIKQVGDEQRAAESVRTKLGGHLVGVAPLGQPPSAFLIRKVDDLSATDPARSIAVVAYDPAKRAPATGFGANGPQSAQWIASMARRGLLTDFGLVVVNEGPTERIAFEEDAPWPERVSTFINEIRAVEAEASSNAVANLGGSVVAFRMPNAAPRVGYILPSEGAGFPARARSHHPTFGSCPIVFAGKPEVTNMDGRILNTPLSGLRVIGTPDARKGLDWAPLRPAVIVALAELRSERPEPSGLGR